MSDREKLRKAQLVRANLDKLARAAGQLRGVRG